MSSSVRIFSLPLDLQLQLDNFIKAARENGLHALVCLSKPVETEAPLPPLPVLDGHGLTENDYKEILALMGVSTEPPTPLPGFRVEKPKPLTMQTVHKYARRFSFADSTKNAEIINREVPARRRANKQAAKERQKELTARARTHSRPIRNGNITNSGAVAVLLKLGMETLKERAREEQARSTNSNASRLEEKRSRSRARKAVAA